MNKKILSSDILLIITAAIWGFGFVAQRFGMNYVGPFTFNAIRFPLGSLSLMPLILFLGKKQEKEIKAAERKILFSSSLIAGSCLFIAVALQQLGLMATTAGNGGFITGLYVIFTPILGIFLGRKTGKATWAGAVLTFAGLYIISAASQFGGLNIGDIVVAISAVFWAFHVLAIDRLVQKTDPIKLSAGQFLVAGFFSLVAAIIFEPALSVWLGNSGSELQSAGLFSWESFPNLIKGLASGTVSPSFIKSAAIPILYGAIASAGIGYTLQVVAQKNAPPAHATIILCLEGSFAVFGGFLLLNEPLGIKTIVGFALMLSGMLVSQFELIAGSRKNA